MSCLCEIGHCINENSVLLFIFWSVSSNCRQLSYEFKAQSTRPSWNCSTFHWVLRSSSSQLLLLLLICLLLSFFFLSSSTVCVSRYYLLLLLLVKPFPARSSNQRAFKRRSLLTWLLVPPHNHHQCDIFYSSALLFPPTPVHWSLCCLWATGIKWTCEDVLWNIMITNVLYLLIIRRNPRFPRPPRVGWKKVLHSSSTGWHVLPLLRLLSLSICVYWMDVETFF